MCVQGSHLEQVVKVSSKKVRYNATEDTTGQAENATSTEVTWEADPSGSGVDTSEVKSKSENVEQDVDRLIDADSNEYVLSRPKGGVALTLDPLLIQVRRAAALLRRCCLHSGIHRRLARCSHMQNVLSASACVPEAEQALRPGRTASLRVVARLKSAGT